MPPTLVSVPAPFLRPLQKGLAKRRQIPGSVTFHNTDSVMWDLGMRLPPPPAKLTNHYAQLVYMR